MITVKGQLMSLWRPIMCRGNPFGVREFPSPGDPPQLLPLGPPPSLPVNNNSRYAKTSSGTKSFDCHMATSPGSSLVNSKSSFARFGNVAFQGGSFKSRKCSRIVFVLVSYVWQSSKSAYILRNYMVEIDAKTSVARYTRIP